MSPSISPIFQMRKRRLSRAKATGEWVKSGNLTTVNFCRRSKCPQTLKVLESSESVFKEKGARWKFRTKFSCHRRKMLKVLGKCHEIPPGLGFCGCIWELWVSLNRLRADGAGREQAYKGLSQEMQQSHCCALWELQTASSATGNMGMHTLELFCHLNVHNEKKTCIKM